MARRKKNDSEYRNNSQFPPARTPEARERQLASLAMDLAERHLRYGTDSSAEIVHFLKLASSRERIEQTKIENETEMIKAKAKAISSLDDSKALMEEAIHAMKEYRGDDDDSV